MTLGPPGVPPGVRLAALADLPIGAARAVEIEAGGVRVSILLARTAGGVFAYLNRCPHARWPLDRPDGGVIVQEQRYIVCAAHLACFALETGAHVGGPSGPGGAGLAPVRIALCEAEIRTA